MTKTIEEELKEAFTAQEDVNEGDGLPETSVSDIITKEEPVNTEKPVDAEVAVERPVVAIDEPVLKSPEPPASLSGAIKAKWKDLPTDVQAEWSKRENDIHQMMTRHDGELRMGREMKEVVSPYMPIIQAEGGTPAKAVSDLLNTAYVLRTAQPAQKAAMVKQIIETYGIDMSLIQENNQDQQQNPELYQMRQEIAQLRQMASPEAMQKQLQERMENDNILSEVNAFKSDPANKHYEQVKAEMAALLGNGSAATIKEAYEMAIWAKADIRSTLLAEQRTAEDTKRKSEMTAKKNAAVSLSGSPALGNKASSTLKKQSLEDEIRAQLQSGRGISI